MYVLTSIETELKTLNWTNIIDLQIEIIELCKMRPSLIVLVNQAMMKLINPNIFDSKELQDDLKKEIRNIIELVKETVDMGLKLLEQQVKEPNDIATYLTKELQQKGEKDYWIGPHHVAACAVFEKI